MKRTMILFLLTCISPLAFSDEILDIYMSNFDKANLNVKLQVLQDCVSKNIEDRGPLFNHALFFLINNYASVKDQNGPKEISILAINQVDVLSFKPAKSALWDLFLLDSATKVRVDILQALSHLANDDQEIITKINTWFASENEQFKFSKTPDLQVASACIKALGNIGDSSSFPALLLVAFAGYPEAQRKAAEEAISSLKGTLKELYISMINTHKLIEKKYALDKALADAKLNTSDKCEVAFAALKITVNEVIETPAEKDISREIRNKAIVFLGDNGWSDAADFGVMHFKRSLGEYDAKIINSTALLPVIKALGQLKSHNSAVVLMDYLDSTNALFEDGKPYDEQIVLQVISSLGKIGDKIARSALLYVGYLRYSDKIKKAADEAFKALK